jgi:hypothetical protein
MTQFGTVWLYIVAAGQTVALQLALHTSVARSKLLNLVSASAVSCFANWANGSTCCATQVSKTTPCSAPGMADLVVIITVYVCVMHHAGRTTRVETRQSVSGWDLPSHAQVRNTRACGKARRPPCNLRRTFSSSTKWGVVGPTAGLAFVALYEPDLIAIFTGGRSPNNRCGGGAWCVLEIT